MPDTTSDPQGSLGPYPRSDIITMSNGYNTYCAQTMWAPNPGSAQTMTGTGPDDWNVDAIMQPAGYTGVQTYPSILQLTNNWNPVAGNWTGNDDTPLANLTTLTGTFDLTNPPVNVGDWWAAYDIWFNPSGEFMIITSSSDERIATNGADIVNPDVLVGAQHFTDMQYGGSDGLNQMVLHGLPQVGSIDLLAVINYWISQGRIDPTATMLQCNYGWELCNTDIGGVASHMVFTVNDYSLTAIGTPVPPGQVSFAGSAATSSTAKSGNVLRVGGVIVPPGPGPQTRLFDGRAAGSTNARAARVSRRHRFGPARAATSDGGRAVLTVGTGGVDLIVSDLTWDPPAPQAGQQVVFTVSVRNVGTVAVPDGRGAGQNIGIGVYLDGAVPPALPITYTNYDGGLAAGARVTQNTISGWASGGAWVATEGNHTVRAWVDDGGQIVEQNDTNNTLDVPVVVIPYQPPPPPPPGTRLFSDQSPWNVVKSAAQFSYLVNADPFLSSQSYGINNGPGYYTPCYFGEVTDPVQTFNVGPGWVDGRPAVFTGRAPEGMVSPAGGDGNMDIVFSDGTMLDCYQARDQGGHVWNVAMAVDTNAWTGFGFAQPDKGNSRATGTTVVGCPQAAGAILERDIGNGTISHGLRIAFNYASMGGINGTQVGYALHNDVGGGGGPIPEGALLMAVGPEPAGLSYWGLQLWIAASTYGVWVTDKLDGPPLIFGDGSQAVIDVFGSYYSAEITAVCQKLRLTTVGFTWPMPW